MSSAATGTWTGVAAEIRAAARAMSIRRAHGSQHGMPSSAKGRGGTSDAAVEAVQRRFLMQATGEQHARATTSASANDRLRALR